MDMRRVTWLLVWFGAVVASVGVGLIPGDYTGESLCGVWGCFPPMQALASLHLLWLLALAPPAVALARWRPGPVARRLGAFVLLFGLLSTACVVSIGLTRWGYTPADPGYAGYAVRRAGYTLATRTDVPALQLVLTGMLVMIAARRQPRSEREGNSDTPASAGTTAAGDGEADLSAHPTPPSTGA